LNFHYYLKWGGYNICARGFMSEKHQSLGNTSTPSPTGQNGGIESNTGSQSPPNNGLVSKYKLLASWFFLDTMGMRRLIYGIKQINLVLAEGVSPIR
jgi:hypothetical protein